MKKYMLLLILLFALIGCTGQEESAESEAPTQAVETEPTVEALEAVVETEPAPTAEPEPDPETTEPPASTEPAEVVEEPTETPVEEAEPVTVTGPESWTDAWILNSTGQTSEVFDNVLVDVTDVYIQTIDGKDYQCIRSTGIPSYVTEVDEANMAYLTNRPKADTDFANGAPTISIGDSVPFGGDVGYVPTSGCTDVGEGYGYWPFGPACPAAQEKDWCFPLDPEPLPEGDVCATGLNQFGAFVNGVSIFNWQDGQSYNREGVWNNEAFVFEIYDLDICVGHSANGNYHHHSDPTCLGEQLGDDGSAHSPIYGFAADGYPIYGPYDDAGTLANSCWKKRDYSANSPTGCGVDGARTCLLVDQFDITAGVIDAPSAGPTTDEFVTSMSGNPIQAESGAFFQDYYYDPECTAQGDAYLDEHNGHYSEELGYHYHTTLVELEDGTLDYAFPHYAGPTLYGQLQDNAIMSCSVLGGASPAGPPPGGGQGRPGGGGGPGGGQGGPGGGGPGGGGGGSD